MLMALAYVPVDDVQEVFEMFREDVPADMPLEGILTYMEETYVGRRAIPARRIRRRKPKYPIELWNQYDAAINGEAKTNNCSEGWHNRFRLLMNKTHPDLYSAISELQKEQAGTELCLIESSLGKATRDAPNPKWVELQNMITNIVSDYPERKAEDEVLGYLRDMSYCISF